MEILTVDGFLDYWLKVRGRTRRVLERVPPAHAEWTFRPGKWTLGDLVRHVAALERYMFAENVHGRPSLYAGCDRQMADGWDEILALWERLGAETTELLRQLDDDRLQERCTTPGGAQIRVWKWLRSMVEHHVHHRGQIYTYLALLAVDTPPLYGLSAEQVEERSGA